MSNRILDVIVPNPNTEPEKSSKEDWHRYATFSSAVEENLDHIVSLNSYSILDSLLRYIVLFWHLSGRD